MSQSKKALGVSLPEGHTGSSFFRHILLETKNAFPRVFHDLKLPSGKEFKKHYHKAVVECEGMRVSSPERSEIAKFVVRRTQDQLYYKGNGFSGSFNDYLLERTSSSKLNSQKLSAPPGLKPKIPFRGRYYTNKNLNELGSILLGENKITKKVANALDWLTQYAKDHDGRIDLSGQKFVIMGASAELAPTSLLLKAGAKVLWVDIQSPANLLKAEKALSGELFTSKDANDVLLQPRKIRATIEEFAAGDPVHIGMYAYAGGASQEWRLAATMNAIIRNLESRIIASVAMLISPTAAAVVQPEDSNASLEFFRNPPAWQAALCRLGLLGERASFDKCGTPIARSIVPIQGISYQAAQYVSKVLAAEVYGTFGTKFDEPASPITVSANVAGITKTRSLNHPVFQAAFLGAKTFGVEIFEVQTTHALNNLLMIHDILNPTSVDPQDISSLFAKQVHGGIYSRAYSLDPMIKIATVIGLAKRPKLILKLF